MPVGKPAPPRPPGRVRREDHRPALAQVVVDHGTHERMAVVAVAEGQLELLQVLGRAQGLHQLAHHVARHFRHDRAVDEQGRGLVRHADAWRVLEGEQAVGRGLPELDAQLGAEGSRDTVHALELIDDVVAKADDEPPARRTGEEGIERRRALDLHPAHREGFRDFVESLGRDAPCLGLHAEENVHQSALVVGEIPADLPTDTCVVCHGLSCF